MRTKGISAGTADLEKNEVNFTLDTDRGAINLIANLGAAQQMLSALAPMAAVLRENANRPGSTYVTAAEEVAEANVAIERFEKVVMLQIVTSTGVPHTFALPPEAADEIAGRLKKQSRNLRAGKAGRA
jgi:hypothetical protein